MENIFSQCSTAILVQISESIQKNLTFFTQFITRAETTPPSSGINEGGQGRGKRVTIFRWLFEQGPEPRLRRHLFGLDDTDGVDDDGGFRSDGRFHGRRMRPRGRRRPRGGRRRPRAARSSCPRRWSPWRGGEDDVHGEARRRGWPDRGEEMAGSSVGWGVKTATWSWFEPNRVGKQRENGQLCYATSTPGQQPQTTAKPPKFTKKPA